MKSKKGAFAIAFLIGFSWSGWPSDPHCLGATFLLQWDPNPEPDIAGYKVHWGTSPRVYQKSMDVGAVTSYELSGLDDGVTYYFAVTAYNVAGLESDYSNEVSGRKNLPPTATTQAYPTSGQAPLAVSFSAQANDPDGVIVSQTWDFGDGTTSSSQNTTHTYTSPGIYNATFTVLDNDGAQSTSLIQVSVTSPPSPTSPSSPPPPQNQPPSLVAAANPTEGPAPLSVSFIASATDPDGSVTAYLWEFGDGETSNQQSPTHVYKSPGTYLAKVTASDNQGASTSKSLTITVSSQNSPPNLSATVYPQEGPQPLKVTFAAQASDPEGGLVSITWDFGDGNISREAVTEHIYTQPGRYTALVEARDSQGATASVSFTIKVRSKSPPLKGFRLLPN
jgi:PKD repeat protein